MRLNMNYKFFNSVFVFLFIYLGIVILNFAQTSPSNPNRSNGSGTQQNIVVSSDQDYIIGENDVLDIQVINAPELSGLFQVNSHGTFILPFIGKFEAKDKTVENITEILSQRLKNGYLNNPIVSVKVSQSNRRAFFIDGAIQKPGTYQIEGKVTLLKLITIAGGMLDERGANAIIMREKERSEIKKVSDLVNSSPKTGNDESYQVFTVNVNRLLEGELDQNLEIYAGDIVRIQLPQKFFVAGQVNKPGEYFLKENTSLQQAISIAGGLDEKFGSTAYVIREKPETSSKKDEEEFEILEVNLKELFSGKINKNIIVQPRDFIHISEAGTFYVAGEVTEPGSFPIQRDGVTVSQAVAFAKGTKPEGDTKNSIIFRQNANGEREKIMVNIAGILKGTFPDVALKSNDIVVVPNSRSKTITQAVIKTLTNGLPSIIPR